MRTEATLHTLDDLIRERSILRHPFYRAWQRGELTPDQLGTYSRVYYPHVAAFPTYLKNVINCTADSSIRCTLEQNLRDELIRGNVPADLEAKLIKLARDNLAHRSIEQNCRTIIALLQAAQQGAFKEASPEACERLLQVLAYVRKDDDAIPDYRPDGFTDDLEQIRAVGTQLGPLLRSFKAWRLRHQVPGMWVGSQTPIELSGISV